MSMRPMASSSFTSRFSSRSPLRRWWWVEMFMPSLSSHFSSAARRLGRSLESEGWRRTRGRVARSTSGFLFQGST